MKKIPGNSLRLRKRPASRRDVMSSPRRSGDANETTGGDRYVRAEITGDTAQKLREYEKVVEGLEEMITVVDRDYRYLLANAAFLRHHELSRAQVVGRFVWEVLEPDLFEKLVKAQLDQCFTGAVVKFEMDRTYPILGVRNLLVSYLPIQGAREIDRVVCVLQDITSGKQTEEARQLAEKKYEDIFKHAAEGIFQSTPDGRYLVANPALALMHGFDSPEALIRERKNISDAYSDPVRREEFKELLEASGSVEGFEFELRRKDGNTIWASINARAVRDENGAVQYYEGTAQDITEKQASQEALRQSEERYRELFENSRDAIYVHDMAGRYTSVNRAAEQLSGYQREEIIGKHYSNFITPAYLRNARENFCRKLDVPVETTYEARILRKDGSTRSVEISSRMVYRNGEPVGVQGTVVDITERKRAQQALQIYSRRLMQAQEAEREIIARELHDEIGQVLTAVNMNLEWIRRSGATKPAGVARVEESIEIVTDALARVRELSLELRPSLLDDLGLAAALRWYAARYSVRTGISAEITGDVPKSAALPRAIETACYRIAQEALTNTARHSRASKASITLEPQPDRIKVTMSDNGVGFDVQRFLNGGGASLALGLHGMQERALAVHGSISFKSEIGKGTEVSLVVPNSPAIERL